MNDPTINGHPVRSDGTVDDRPQKRIVLTERQFEELLGENRLPEGVGVVVWGCLGTVVTIAFIAGFVVRSILG